MPGTAPQPLGNLRREAMGERLGIMMGDNNKCMHGEYSCGRIALRD